MPTIYVGISWYIQTPLRQMHSYSPLFAYFTFATYCTVVQRYLPTLHLQFTVQLFTTICWFLIFSLLDSCSPLFAYFTFAIYCTVVHHYLLVFNFQFIGQLFTPICLLFICNFLCSRSPLLADFCNVKLQWLNLGHIWTKSMWTHSEIKLKLIVDDEPKKTTVIRKTENKKKS